MALAWVRIVAGAATISFAAPSFTQAPLASAPAADPARMPAIPPIRELCRILIPGLPVERQPPPLDCEAARRQAVIAGGEVVVIGRERPGSLRFSVADDRYRRDQALRDVREEERNRALRDRDWRDGTWDDRSRFDDDDLRVWRDD